MTQESSSEQAEVKTIIQSNLVQQRCARSSHTFIKKKTDKNNYISLTIRDRREV